MNVDNGANHRPEPDEPLEVPAPDDCFEPVPYKDPLDETPYTEDTVVAVGDITVAVAVVGGFPVTLYVVAVVAVGGVVYDTIAPGVDVIIVVGPEGLLKRNPAFFYP